MKVEFVDRTVGQNIPKGFIPSIEKVVLVARRRKLNLSARACWKLVRRDPSLAAPFKVSALYWRTVWTINMNWPLTARHQVLLTWWTRVSCRFASPVWALFVRQCSSASQSYCNPSCKWRSPARTNFRWNQQHVQRTDMNARAL